MNRQPFTITCHYVASGFRHVAHRHFLKKHGFSLRLKIYTGPSVICQSVGPPHILPRLYTVQPERVPGTQKRCRAQPARGAREPGGQPACAQSTLCQCGLSDQASRGRTPAISKKQLYLRGAGTT